MCGGKGHFHFGKDPVRHVDSQFYVPDSSKQTEEEHFKHFVSSPPRFTCPICKLHFRTFTTQLRGVGDFVIYFFCFFFRFFAKTLGTKWVIFSIAFFEGKPFSFNLYHSLLQLVFKQDRMYHHIMIIFFKPHKRLEYHRIHI